MNDDLNLLHAWGSLTKFVREKAPPLHHYTDAIGLHGIVTSHALWATAAQFSNDLSEIEYSLSVAREVFEEIFKTELEPDSWKRFLRDYVERFFSAPSHEFNQPFIFSFCEDGDLLSQWRAYGQKSGFSLEFKDLEDADGRVALQCENGFRTILRKVIYDPGQQRLRLRVLLGQLLKLAEGIPNTPASHHSSSVRGELILISVFELGDWTCTVKHSAFSGEREWRLISFPNFAPTSVIQNEILIRPTPDLLLPYMVLTPTAGKKLPLVGVRCGPSRLQKEGARSVEILLKKQDYDKVNITRSEIPLRT